MLVTVGRRIAELRELSEKTQDELAREIGITRSALSLYELDKREPDFSTLQKIAEHFRVSADYLLGATDDPRTAEQIKREAHAAPFIRVPLLGTIKAGIPVLAEENWEGEVEIPADWRADFALHVSGDSMSWAGIHSGDTAILRQVSEAQHGQIVAAGVEDDTWLATLKYFIRENGHAVLRAANPEYADMPITGKHRVIGHLVGVLKDAPPYQEYRALLTSKAAADDAWAKTIETAVQLGLDGSEVEHMIKLFAKVSRS
jgi:repressor LexA